MAGILPHQQKTSSALERILQTFRTQLHTMKLRQFILQATCRCAELCIHLLHPLRDSCSSHHQMCPSTTSTQQQGLATLWTHPRSSVHYYFFHTRVSACLCPPCVLFLFCLPRPLVTHAVDTLNWARQEGRNEVGLCWNMPVGVKYSAADSQRCLKLWLL